MSPLYRASVVGLVISAVLYQPYLMAAWSVIVLSEAIRSVKL